jgi:hypothetical protein
MLDLDSLHVVMARTNNSLRGPSPAEMYLSRLGVYWPSVIKRETYYPPLAFLFIRTNLSFMLGDTLVRPFYYPLTETLSHILSSRPLAQPLLPIPPTFQHSFSLRHPSSVTFLNHDDYFGLLRSLTPP